MKMADKKEEHIKDSITSFREGNISLILDSYDDIFSDFDPRSYDERALSDDFLYECKKAARDKGFKTELRFLIPKNKRNNRDETKIRYRLKGHFNRHHKELESEITKTKLSGAVWFVIGALIITFGTLIFTYANKGFFYNLLFVMSEPAGWFFFWEGLGKIFIHSKSNKKDFDFYKKMSRAEIYFFDY